MAEERTALLDVNVLVALAWSTHVHHARAHRWLRAWEGSWATTPVTEIGLVRQSMNPAVVQSPVGAAQALAVLGAIRATPGHRFVADDSSLADPLIDLRSLAGHTQVTDFHLVDLCVRSGTVLATLDARLPNSLRESDRHHVVLLPA